ncbi:MAG: hypothetical protein IT289_02775 [Oligoflexia bacterium]|nr:hypothetical protein [Oligoflexia bacterium]
MSAVKKLEVPKSLPQPKTSHRILVVEDESEIVSAYNDILAPQGAPVVAIKSSRSKGAPQQGASRVSEFEVVAVNNGEDAVQEVKKALQQGRPFAMGFFDVLLGNGIDGIETVRRIHELDSRMYTVLVTAYQDRHIDSIEKIFGKEFQDRWDYLNKPFTEGEILQKARNMVSMWNLREKELAQSEFINLTNSQVIESEKMHLIGAVARNVGHEFGNILLQIMGRAELGRDGSSEEMKKSLDTILVAAEHAGKVLEKFKNLVKPSDSHSARQVIKVREPIEETLLLMDHELKRRTIEVGISGDLDQDVYAHKSSLVQVFMNLFINACHAIAEHGKINVSVSSGNDEVKISVHDSGSGIPPENLPKVFDSFFTTKGSKGTGLGLPICKEIIEISHGGTLSVRNHPQGGAVFEITLPTKAEEGL